MAKAKRLSKWARSNITARFDLTGKDREFVMRGDPAAVRRKYMASSYRGDGTTLVKEVKTIGKGAFGEVAIWESDRGKQYAVKTVAAPSRGNSEYNSQKYERGVKALRRESKALELIHKTLPPYLKRFFVKPKRVVFFDKRNSEMCVGNYLRTLPVECLTAHLGMEVISGSVTLKDFFNHWKYGPNPLKPNSRGQYGTFKNDGEWRRAMTRIFRDIKRAVLGLWWHTGYFHADLHLNNIMIDPKTLRIKIIDFGLARAISEGGKSGLRKLVKGKKEPWKDKKLLQKLDDDWKAWFISEWMRFGPPRVGKTGNPNSIYFKMLDDPKVKFYANRHKTLIENIRRRVSLEKNV